MFVVTSFGKNIVVSCVKLYKVINALIVWKRFEYLNWHFDQLGLGKHVAHSLLMNLQFCHCCRLTCVLYYFSLSNADCSIQSWSLSRSGFSCRSIMAWLLARCKSKEKLLLETMFCALSYERIWWSKMGEDRSKPIASVWHHIIQVKDSCWHFPRFCVCFFTWTALR